MSWELVEAGDLMARRNGSVNPANFSNEQFELHSIPAFDLGRPEVLFGSEIGSAKQVVQPNDVMISKIVPHIRRSSVVGKSSGLRQIASGEWIVFRSGRFFPHYLRHLLISNQFNAQFMATVSGVGGSLLRARPAEVAKIKIPLPPVNEQRRIAAILDKADALRAQRRAAIAKLDELLQSTFIEMFGDPVTNPRGWPETTSLGEVAGIVSGITKGRKTTATTREVAYMAVSNVQDRFLKLDVVKRIEATDDEIEKYRLQRDDLLLTEGGDPDKLGRGVLWHNEIAECIHQNHVFRVRLNSDQLHPLYLNWYVGSERGKRYFLRQAKQTTGIASINMRQLRGLPLLMPPLNLQQRFAQVAEKIGSQKQTMLHAVGKSDTLFASLQQRAFSGKL